MTDRLTIIRLLYAFEDRLAAAAIQEVITRITSVPVAPAHAISSRFEFPKANERALLIYSSNWRNLDVCNFFIKASAVVKDNVQYDLRVMTLPSPTLVDPGFPRYLTENGAARIEIRSMLAALVQDTDQRFSPRPLLPGHHLGIEIASAIRHGGNQGIFLRKADKMKALIPWLRRTFLGGRHEGD